MGEIGKTPFCLILLLSTVVATVTADSSQKSSSSEEQCPPNQVFSTCHSACQPNCTYTPTICTRQCVIGCACIRGYVIGPNGDCIPKRRCPRVTVAPVTRPPVTRPPVTATPSCPPNQVFSTCHSACQPNCTYVPEVCTLQCVIGCACATGYVIGPNGDCIPKENCPVVTVPPVTRPPVTRPPVTATPSCPPNQFYSTCHSACQPNCTYTPEICTKQCVIGCACIIGYVIGPDGDCIPKEKCPVVTVPPVTRPPVTRPPVTAKPSCPPNQYYSTCHSACHPNCTHVPEVCTLQCVIGCACIPGYVIGPNGDCILKENCPAVTVPPVTLGPVTFQPPLTLRPVTFRPPFTFRPFTFRQPVTLRTLSPRITLPPRITPKSPSAVFNPPVGGDSSGPGIPSKIQQLIDRIESIRSAGRPSSGPQTKSDSNSSN